MRLSRGSGIEIKTAGQFAAMREAGLVVAHVLSAVAVAAEPGISTAELDAIAADIIRGAGAKPSFLGYHGYPATICTSVNDEIVHGIPSERVRLVEGDVLSIDAGAIVGGWHGDAAVTIGIGEISAEAVALIDACERALWAGIGAVAVGARLTDISHAVETSALASGGGPAGDGASAVRSDGLALGGRLTGGDGLVVRGGYGIVQEYTGHFIGSAMHMDPPVPNYGKPGRGPVLTEGMAMAIEPMLTLGDRHTKLLADDWTVVTADGSLAAHFEHTVAITAEGLRVLTAADGGESGFAKLGCVGSARGT